MHFYELAYKVYEEEGNKCNELYSQAIEWLESLGFPYSKNRFGKYKKAIDQIDTFSKNESDDEFKTWLHEFLNAHLEITEIIRIYNDVSKYNFIDYIEQLKMVTKGQEFRTSSAKDQSRDFTFELSMAARFIRSGFEVKLNQLADVVAKREDTPKIYVECKRIKSLSKVRKNIKKANEQLRTRLSRDNSSRSRGLVALNINDILNENCNMFVFDNIEKFQQFNSEILNQFVLNNEEELKAKKFEKVLGVFCEHIDQAFLYDRDPPAIANCRGVKLYQYSRKKEDLELIATLAQSLSNQNLYG